jgi:hypothetical protein
LLFSFISIYLLFFSSILSSHSSPEREDAIRRRLDSATAVGQPVNAEESYSRWVVFYIFVFLFVAWVEIHTFVPPYMS